MLRNSTVGYFTVSSRLTLMNKMKILALMNKLSQHEPQRYAVFLVLTHSLKNKYYKYIPYKRMFSLHFVDYIRSDLYNCVKENIILSQHDPVCQMQIHCFNSLMNASYFTAISLRYHTAP